MRDRVNAADVRKDPMLPATPIPSGRRRLARQSRPRFLRLLALACALATGSMVLADNPSEPPKVAHGVLPQTATNRTAANEAGTNETISERRARAASVPAASPDSGSPDSGSGSAGAEPSPPSAAIPVENTTLQSPEDVPAPNAVLPITVIGRIQIPKIGIDAELRDQITQESIDLGPSHWPGTAAPGGFGNAVIAGHRNSYSAPFRDVESLGPGDTISLVVGSRTFTYSVTELFVVEPSEVWITEQTPGRTLTLFTCHPLGQATHRLVVRAQLI